VADNFADFFGSVITVTNTIGATNKPARYCRVRLVP
jgi:hypothetical protein